MINIWATFCDPCIREMPELGKLNSDYSEKGVQVIGIVADIIKTKDGFDTYYVDRARDLVEKTGAAYTHLMPSADLVAAKLEKVNAVPYTIFVDSSGEIVGEAYAGARSYKSWAEIIEETVAVMN